MTYTTEGSQENCYPDSTVLINKFNIRNQHELDMVEKQITLLRGVQAEQETAFTDVDFDFYKNLHKKIFGDIYEWAGSVRTVNISKKGTVFCNADEIEHIGALKFRRLKNMNYLKDMNDGKFLDELTDLYHELNMLHPFREGNGRTLRLFIALLVRNTDRDIDFGGSDSDLLMIAAIKAAQGDRMLLRQVFGELIYR